MAETANWIAETDSDGVAWLTFDSADSPVNVLSRAVLQELAACLTKIAAQRPRALVLRSAKSSGFIAGADIKEFTTMRTPEEGLASVLAGQAVLDQLAALPCPSVAAIQGFALGGGLELALACTYRVGADDGKLSLGLPEVQLGIHPGFGGTVRSVRLMGVRPAMELMLRGKPFSAARARATGLVDLLVPAPELLSRAKALVLQAPRRRRAPPFEQLLNLGIMRPFIARQLAGTLRAKVIPEHYPAPYAIVGLWRAVRRERGGQLYGRGRVHRLADEIADRAQPDPGVPAAGPAQGPWRQVRARIPRMCMSSAPASWAATSPPGRQCAA